MSSREFRIFVLAGTLMACGRVGFDAVVVGPCPELQGSLCRADASATAFDAAPDYLPDAEPARDSADAEAFDDPSSYGDAARPAEVCDGIDNDGDGEIDNVDLGGDGICDCLTLATLGIPGTWGAGDVLAEWLSQRSDVGATALDELPLTPTLLAQYRVIVIQDIQANTLDVDEISALQDWIAMGGGLFTTMGYDDSPSERDNVNAILAPTGIQYGAAQVFVSNAYDTLPISIWHPHPVSSGVTAIGADVGYEVNGGGTVVAEQDGVVALRAVTFGTGHVLVWTDEWITYDSEWQDHPEYQVELFWLNAIKWLSPPRDCQVEIPIL